MPATASAEVYISEIAWMGNSESANYEWIEFYSTEVTSLEGWSLTAVDGTPDVSLSGEINGVLLLERNEVALSSPADILYAGALENSGEILILTNADGVEVDRVDGSSNWSSVGGDNATKETAQYTNGVWKTASPTPGAVETIKEEIVVEEVTSSYTKPELVLDFPKEIRIVAGNEAVFYAKIGDTDGTRFDSATVVWNFGDGTRIQGNNIYHVYEYPGTYIAKVTGRYGREEVSQRVVVTVHESEISFSYIDQNVVRIENGDKEELDISRWRVVSEENIFQFPEETFIMGETSLMLSHKVAGFFFSKDAKLTYSNGEQVSKIEEIKKEIVYVPIGKEAEVQEEEEVVSIQPAAAVVADTGGSTISIWVYSWIVLVLLVGGSIVYIRRYG
tara:strand:+ start:8019 stop:9188 length:1170 start_codon:yes stop_codon:yes gene_type:complete